MITRVSSPSRTLNPLRPSTCATSCKGIGCIKSISPDNKAARPVAAFPIGVNIASVILCSAAPHHPAFGAKTVLIPGSRLATVNGPVPFTFMVAKFSASRAGSSAPFASAQPLSRIIKLAIESGNNGFGALVTKSMV